MVRGSQHHFLFPCQRDSCSSLFLFLQGCQKVRPSSQPDCSSPEQLSPLRLPSSLPPGSCWPPLQWCRPPPVASRLQDLPVLDRALLLLPVDDPHRSRTQCHSRPPSRSATSHSSRHPQTTSPSRLATSRPRSPTRWSPQQTRQCAEETVHGRPTGQLRQRTKTSGPVGSG